MLLKGNRIHLTNDNTLGRNSRSCGLYCMLLNFHVLLIVCSRLSCTSSVNEAWSCLLMILLQVRITEWIYQQLCQCTAPIHSVVPSLIEAFVTSIIVPAARGDCTNEPIPEEHLLGVFEDPFSLRASGTNQIEDVKNSTFTTHILLVYYLLLYEDTLLSNMSSISEYSDAFHLTLE